MGEYKKMTKGQRLGREEGYKNNLLHSQFSGDTPPLGEPWQTTDRTRDKPAAEGVIISYVRLSQVLVLLVQYFFFF